MEIVKAISGTNGVREFVTENGLRVKQGVRTIKRGNDFSRFIDTSKVTFTKLVQEGGYQATIEEIKRIIKCHHPEVSKLAAYLEKRSRLETCRSVWDFVFNHIQYKRDKVGVEQLSTPSRIWLNRSKVGTPTDCDDHTIFVGSLLYCLGIPFTIRIAGYDMNDFSHVYIVVDDSICIDTVLHRFNCEADYSSKSDSKMRIETLQGLGGSDSSLDGALEGLHVSANAYDQASEADELNGIGDAQEEANLRRLGRAQLGIALEEYKRDPKTYHALGFNQSYWNHAQKIYNELESGSLEGIIVRLNDGVRAEQKRYRAINGLGQLEGEIGMLGMLEGWFKRIRRRAKRKLKKLGRRIKKVAKKSFKVVKKVGKFVLKMNPVFIAVRAGIRLAISKNFFDLALKFGYGLLTESQAKSIGCNLDQWKRSRHALDRFVKKYKWLGGSSKKIRSTIGKSWEKYSKKKGLKTISHRQLRGLEDDMEIEIGVLPALAIPAATGIIGKAMKFLKPFLLKILRGLKLEKMFIKLKQKHISNLKKKIVAPGLDPRKKADLDRRIKRAEDNLKLIAAEEKKRIAVLEEKMRKVSAAKAEALKKKIARAEANIKAINAKEKVIEVKKIAINKLPVIADTRAHITKTPVPVREIPSENNLVIVNREDKTPTPPPLPEFKPVAVATTPKQAGMNPFLIGGMALVLGGIALSANSNSKKNTNSKKKNNDS